VVVGRLTPFLEARGVTPAQLDAVCSTRELQKTLVALTLLSKKYKVCRQHLNIAAYAAQCVQRTHLHCTGPEVVHSLWMPCTGRVQPVFGTLGGCYYSEHIAAGLDPIPGGQGTSPATLS
jgi:hypothetical protein